MAQVRNSDGPVTLDTRAPDDYQHIQASPDAFGAQVGQGLQQVGEGLHTAGQFYGQVATDEAVNNYSKATNELLYGTGKVDPATGQPDSGYYGLRGADAMKAAPDIQKQLTKLRDQTRKGLYTPEQQLQFDTNTRRTQSYLSGEVGRHSEQQSKVWGQQVNKDGYKTALDGVALRPKDDVSAQAAMQTALSFRVKQMQLDGTAGSPEAMTQAHTDVARDVTEARIKALAPTNPTRAVAVMNANRTLLAGSSNYDQLDNYVSEVATRPYEQLADQNVTAAYAKYQTDRASLPMATQTRLDAFFQPKVRNVETRNTADQILGGVNKNYSAGQPPTVGANLDAAKQDLNLTPQEENLYQHHLGNVSRAVQNADGSQSTALVAGVGINGREYNIPTVWDGKKLSVDESVARAKKEGLDKFPSYASPEEASARYDKMHGYMAKDIKAAPAPDARGALIQTQADYYRSHYDDILETARKTAERQHPDDPVYSDQVVSRIEQRMGQVIRQQELSYKADNDLVVQAFNGDFSKGSKPTSIDQLTAASPEVKKAWDRLQVNNPVAAANIENKILTANAKETDRDVKTYGTAYYNLFKRIHAPADSPDRISDVTELYGHVGDDLTTAGLNQLKGEISGRGTPDAVANSQMKKAATDYAMRQLSFEVEIGNFKVNDPNGRNRFDVGFLPAFNKAYEKGIADGKSPYDLLSKDSPDFIVDKLIAANQRTPGELMHDRIEAGATADLASPPVAAAVQKALPPLPKVGEVRQGYQFRGGNPGDKNNWTPTNAAVPVK